MPPACYYPHSQLLYFKPSLSITIQSTPSRQNDCTLAPVRQHTIPFLLRAQEELQPEMIRPLPSPEPSPRLERTMYQNFKLVKAEQKRYFAPDPGAGLLGGNTIMPSQRNVVHDNSHKAKPARRSSIDLRSSQKVVNPTKGMGYKSPEPQGEKVHPDTIKSAQQLLFNGSASFKKTDTLTLLPPCSTGRRYSQPPLELNLTHTSRSTPRHSSRRVPADPSGISSARRHSEPDGACGRPPAVDLALACAPLNFEGLLSARRPSCASATAPAPPTGSARWGGRRAPAAAARRVPTPARPPPPAAGSLRRGRHRAASPRFFRPGQRLRSPRCARPLIEP